MHDDEQIARLYDLDLALKAGSFPPRIAPNLGFGYGYPFFNFYPSFAYYVGEIFHLMGFGYIDSTKLMLITGFLLSAFFMYIFIKEISDEYGGVASAIAYTYSSYHAVDIYVRGAFAEFFAFVFIPLIFWSIYKLSKSENLLYIIAGSLGLAGLILSHNLVTMMSGIFILFWIIYVMYYSENKKRFLLKSAFMVLLGFGVSAYFWLPSFAERNFTLVNILTKELADYNIHFVCVRQLWASAWGYGGSVPGCTDGISFEIGKLLLLISLFALILSIYFLIKGKHKRHSILIILFNIYLGLSSFLMVKYSKFIWDLIPVFWYIQFPWRFLIISAFAASAICGSIFYFIKDKKAKLAISIIFIIIFIFTNISRFEPEKNRNVNDNYYTNLEKIRWETSSLAYEYVPKGIATKKSVENTTIVDISKDQIAKSPYKVINGNMTVKVISNLPQFKKFNVDVKSPGIFQINTYSFPGWKIKVNNTVQAYRDKNKLKLIQIDLKNGQNIVVADFADTFVRTTGNITSFLSIIVFAAITITAIIKKKK